MAGCNCGGASSARIQYEAKSRTGTVKTFGTSADAKVWLAQNGGGTHKAVPVK